MVSSTNLFPIDFPQMSDNGVITQDELTSENGVLFKLEEYSDAAVGDYISLNFDVTMSFYLYLKSEPVSQYFPWSDVIPQNLVPDGNYQSWYVVVDNAGNSGASPVSNIFVDREQQGTLPAPTFPEASTNNNVIDDALASSDGGTTVYVPAYSNIIEGDSVVVYWSGFNEINELVPGSSTTITHIVTRDELSSGFTITVPTPYITVIGTGTAQSWYTVHNTAHLPERSFNSSSVIIETTGQRLPAPYFPEGNDGWIDSNDIVDGTPLAIPAYRNISAGDSVTTYWQGYTQDGLIIPSAYNQQVYIIGSADLANGFSVTIPESALEPVGVGYGQSYYFVDFIMAGAGTGTSVKAQVNVDTEHVAALPAPVFSEAINNTINAQAAISGAGTPMVISYTPMSVGDVITLQWMGYHYGDVQPVPGSVYTMTHTVTNENIQTNNFTALIPTSHILPINSGYAVGNYQLTYHTGGIGYSDSSNVLISSDLLYSLKSNKTQIQANGIDAATLTATVLDSLAQPAENIPVYWSTSEGQILPSMSVTNALGNATCQLTSTTSGNIAAVATLANQNSRTIEISAINSDCDTISELTSNKAKIQANGTDAAILSATVVDAYGKPAADINVHWSSSKGILSADVSSTNSEGIASTQLTSEDAGMISIIAKLDDNNTRSISIVSEEEEPKLHVLGARSSIHASSQSQVGMLSVFESTTLNSIKAYWFYEGECPQEASHTFIDTKPYLPLSVQSTTNSLNLVTLNESNVTGNGHWDDDGTGTGSFVALLNDGTAIGWGDPEYGGIVPPAGYNKNVYSLSATFESFATLRAPGEAYAWGEDSEGGSVPSRILSRTDIISVKGTQGTFACLGTNSPPYVDTWGWATNGHSPFNLNVPNNIASRCDIVALIAGDNSFAVTTSSGNVLAWGDPTAGGDVPHSISCLNSITECCASRRAYAVIYENGRLQAWGDIDYGADASSVSSVTTAQRLVATESAFTALLSNGSIVNWGYKEFGGNLPSEYRSITNIIDIKSTYGAFAALCADGSVFCWGSSDYGGDCHSVAHQLTDVVSISANGASFAALKRSGCVVTWGNTKYGGSTSNITGELTNVLAIYGNTHAFIALKSDNSVVAWGEQSSGVSTLPESINGKISYLKA